jgi:hypothetical protein
MFSTHPVRLTQYTSKSSRVTKCTHFFCNASRTCPMWSPILCLIHSNHFGCMMHKLSKFYLWTFFNYSPEHSLVVCMPRKRLTPRHVQGGTLPLGKEHYKLCFVWTKQRTPGYWILNIFRVKKNLCFEKGTLLFPSTCGKMLPKVLCCVLNGTLEQIASTCKRFSNTSTLNLNKHL